MPTTKPIFKVIMFLEVCLLLCLVFSSSCGMKTDSDRDLKREHRIPIEKYDCKYEKFPGKAKILSIEPQTETNNYNEKDRLIVRYEFIPDTNFTEEEMERAGMKLQDLSIGSGQNPPRKCVEAQNFTVGSVHPAEFLRLTGVRPAEFSRLTEPLLCNPTVYTVTDFNSHLCI
jgi:hypothetical protein